MSDYPYPTINVIKEDTPFYQEMKRPTMNGRVLIQGPPAPGKDYPLYTQNNAGLKNYKCEAVKHILSPNKLQEIFFSKENIDNLQNQLRYWTWIESNKKHIVARQSDDDMVIIMRSVYFQYGKNLDFNIADQVKELNGMVLQYALPVVLSNIEQYLYYKYDVSRLPEPIPLPVLTTTAGTRTHPNFLL